MAKNNESMKSTIGSGFDCPTIGSTVPKGHMLVRGSDGKWQIVRKQANNKRAGSSIAKEEGIKK